MAEATKTVSEWEQENGVIFTDDNVDLKSKVTADEFEKLRQQHVWAAVNVEARTKWLKDNGYDVTRENLVNVDLPSKQAQDSDES